jgi:hypothetical protein
MVIDTCEGAGRPKRIVVLGLNGLGKFWDRENVVGKFWFRGDSVGTTAAVRKFAIVL